MRRFSIRKIIVFVYGMALLAVAGSALADTPPITPQQFMVCSKNQEYCAVVYRVCLDTRKGCEYGEEVTRVKAYKLTNNESFPMWRIYNESVLLWSIYEEVWPETFWRNGHYLSDDGHYLVEQRWFNRIPANFKKPMTMLKVYQDGDFKFSIELKDLIKDNRKLVRSISTFGWGQGKGFDNKGNFIVETVEKRRLLIDIKTGEITEKKF